MKNRALKQLANQFLSVSLSLSMVFSSLMMPVTANAATLALPNVPLDVTSTTFAAKPNFMYILDNSGSMKRDYITNSKSDDAPALLDYGQCKAAIKNKPGFKILDVAQVGNRLKIKADGGPFTLQDKVFITIPEYQVGGKPFYSGVYKVVASNYTASGCDTALTATYTTYNPACYNPKPAGWVGVDAGRHFDVGCACSGKKPDNSIITNDASNHTTQVNYSDGYTLAADPSGSPTAGAPSGACFTYDYPDLATTSCPAGHVIAGGDGFEFEIDIIPVGSDKVLTAAEVKDAYVQMGVDFTTDAIPVEYIYNESSDCDTDHEDNSTAGFEPPNATAQVNSLYYDPTVNYEPPPQPNKITNAYPNNLLPSMTRSYTSEWSQVPNNGLILVSGIPLTPSQHASAGAAVDLSYKPELVFCDTPRMPAAYTYYKDWFASNRCQQNLASNNTSVRSPNYPYKFPATIDGLTSGNPSNPSQTPLYFESDPHQYGDANMTSVNLTAGVTPNAFSPSSLGVDGFYVFGVRNGLANPHYFNITPIEYCTTAQLTNCALASTFTPVPTPVNPPAAYPFPSYVRYCKSPIVATNAAAAPAAGACQAQYTGSVTTDWGLTGGPDYRFARYGLFNRVEITKNGSGNIDSSQTYAKKLPTPAGCDLAETSPVSASFCTNKGRVDCKATAGVCTADEEMTNYANWWAYYRTRNLMMKSASAHAFNSLDANMRVGLMTINDPQEANGVDTNGNGVIGSYLKIDDFDDDPNGQKEQWLTTLYAVPETDAATPLRKALSIAGHVFAGKATLAEVGEVGDPVQYYCQKNISLLTTDGFWTGSLGDGTATNVVGTAVGNQDGGASPPKKDGNNASNTLADLAMYYNTSGMRKDSSFAGYNNCQNTSGITTGDLCTLDSTGNLDEAQKMHTFTMGLGVDGTVGYDKNYETGTSPDYELIKAGSKDWPIPVANQPEAVDDLWHAAVNGDGSYFSARSPQDVTSALQRLFTALKAGVSAGTPPAVTSQKPSSDAANPDYAFSTSYIKSDWTGNLVARELSSALGSLFTANDPLWCADTPYFPSTGLVCDMTDGGLLPNVSAASRNILMAGSGTSGLKSFLFTNLTAPQKAYFQASNINSLRQWAFLTTTQKAAADEDNLVNFIRGDKTYEQSSTTPANRLFRTRKGILGDITESDPVFVGAPVFKYLDAGYQTPLAPATTSFVADQITQAKKTVYVGANDGMLHAFDATNGHERWAFIPTALLPKLYKLASFNYSDNHVNYVNGKAAVGDYFDGTKWRKLLVSGFGGGARGLFALDITNPDSPILLWENVDNKLGYIYGKPTIAKKEDGTWVVLTTSGYNNAGGTIGGDGHGRFLQINPTTGAIASSADVSTVAAIVTTPSFAVNSAHNPGNLASLSALAFNPLSNASAKYAYAGDVYGNLWVYNITSNTVKPLARLSSTKEQPITTAPILARVNSGSDVLVVVGTGKLLELADIASTDVQTIYAIKDNLSGAYLGSPRDVSGNAAAGFVKQTFVTTATTRTVPTINPVDLSTGKGWWVDLNDTGERSINRGFLLADVLLVPSVSSGGATCAPTGHSWLNHFDFNTGATLGSAYMDAAVVGVLGLVKTNSISGNETVETLAIGVDNNENLSNANPVSSAAPTRNRMGWHELVN
ncbi:MAG: PilC/PilY family type IV pilus protein [Methylophilaceae bacterium]